MRREALFTLRRVGLFLCLVAVLSLTSDAVITGGLRRVGLGQYGVSNRLMDGRINAQIVITGSSRADAHYDPSIIQRETGLSTINLGRNGSQTDMQLAVLMAYLKHNSAPELVIHNLDAFSFQTTREVYNPAQYVPYLSEEEIYRPLQKINPEIWKSRYVPLYGYVVEDMSYAWVEGVVAWFPWRGRAGASNGFDPRSAKWTGEFASFKSTHPDGVQWDIEAPGVQLMQKLIRACQDRGARVILVYSPEYREMQKLTKNRKAIFEAFHKLSSSYGVPLWDYSDWQYAGDTTYFVNSQHLNADGAYQFTSDLARRLRNYFDCEKGSASGCKKDAVN